MQHYRKPLLVLLIATLGYAAALPVRTLLTNPRVVVKETTYLPGVPRERYTRPTDQVIVFLDDCRYSRKDSATGEVTVRTRKSGEVIWHNKGEDAPVLTNLGTKPYRTLTIEMP